MRNQKLSHVNHLNPTKSKGIYYGFLVLLNFFHVFLYHSLLSCPFDWLYALKPKNPEWFFDRAGLFWWLMIKKFLSWPALCFFDGSIDPVFLLKYLWFNFDLKNKWLRRKGIAMSRIFHSCEHRPRKMLQQIAGLLLKFITSCPCFFLIHL